MSYWISLVSDDREHREIWHGVYCSWNYSDMMIHLPCGWARDWQGKQAQDMIKPIEKSIMTLEMDSEEYEQFERDTDNNIGTIPICKRILQECLIGFQQHPKGIIVID